MHFWRKTLDLEDCVPISITWLAYGETGDTVTSIVAAGKGTFKRLREIDVLGVPLEQFRIVVHFSCKICRRFKFVTFNY